MKTIVPCLAAAAFILSACSQNSTSPATPPAPTPVVTPTPVVVAPTPVPTTLPHVAVVGKELMITDLSVVNDDRTKGPAGPWSFGGLMTRLAGATDPKRFILDWLKTWEAAQTVNGLNVPARSSIRSLVIDGWKSRDGQAGASDAAWTMNLANAPFRLLAIVNRIDLNRIDDPSDKTAGEGRFVFGVLGPTGAPQPFTVIFEFRLIGTDRARLRGWAQEWHALGAQPAFGPQFNAALQVITDKFSGVGGRLNQIRTNEIALSGPWELREFRLVGGALVESPTLQTPANSFDGSATLTRFIDQNEPDILDGTVQIPAQFENAPFLAGSSQVPFNFFWQAPGVQNKEARHKLSVLTCNGCHHVETGTTSFLHVANRAPNAEAVLSGFLKGIEVNAPDNPGVKHAFHDLADRADILTALATESGTVRIQSLTQQRRARVH